MSFVRGRFVPEIESAGRVKHCLDVLIWADAWKMNNAEDLDQIDFLRQYFLQLNPPPCEIHLLVPHSHMHTLEALKTLGIEYSVVEIRTISPTASKLINESEMRDIIGTALANDIDVIAVTNAQWLPYIPEIKKFGLALTDTSFLKYYCEIFARGHDVPWTFTPMVWNRPWTGFYFQSEQRTFDVSGRFLDHAKNALGADAQETARSLVLNRMSNICFTRDRLLFYELCKMAARRANWRRQTFIFEIAYYLNFYALLIFGAFDQLALLVSRSLQLGIPDKNVGATYKAFLTPLKAKKADSSFNLYRP